MDVSESLLQRLSTNQQKIVRALIEKPQGLLSRELTRKTEISNKSDIIDSKLKLLLATEGLEIHTKRISREWLWFLQPTSSGDRS